MDDEDLFRRAMRSLGVSPLENDAPPPESPAVPGPEEPPPRKRKRHPRSEPIVPDEEDELFLLSMKGLERSDKAGLPDKDRPASRPRVPPRIRKVKAAKRRAAEPEATLDLHGCTSRQALDRLESFVASSAGERLKSVIVVTGKGLRSERGVPVIRQAVERWLRREGRKWVRAFSEAPRALGGSGAFVLYLR